MRILGVILALSCLGADIEVESSLVKGPKFLARHQLADGSWGAQSISCSCPRRSWRSWQAPAGLSVDAATRERVGILLERLDRESVEDRNQAMIDLVHIGTPAGPQLEEAAKSGSGETALRAGDALLGIMGEKSDLELTSLALLVFLEAGYAPGARVVHSEINFGDVVMKGLLWVKSVLEDSRAIEVWNARSRLVATLVLTGAWRLTESEQWKEPALKALEKLDTFRSEEVRTLAWGGLLVRSAEMGHLPLGGQSLREISETLERKDGELAFFSSLLLGTWSKRNRGIMWLTALWKLEPESADPEAAWFAAMGGWRLMVLHNAPWAAKSEAFRNCLNGAQSVDAGRCECGSWKGDGLQGMIRTSALRLLTLEACYQYVASMAMAD